jgi:hypothetical protein
MIARISFESGQKVSPKELEQLRKSLADEISITELYIKSNGSIESFYSWLETVNPEEANIPDEKGKVKVLVTKYDKVSLDHNKEYVADLESFLRENPQIQIKVRGFVKITPTYTSDLINQMSAVEEKLETALRNFNKDVEFNPHCDVHVANLGLLHINQLGYITDACTEVLQDILNEGWRIIACCVQPDGRRPDYVLGRHNPENTSCVCVKF